MFDRCENDECTFGPYDSHNRRKKVWTYRGQMTEEWVNANGANFHWVHYENWNEVCEDYDEEEFEVAPHWWEDRNRDSYFFCDDCHAALMGRQIPTIVEDDLDLAELLAA